LVFPKEEAVPGCYFYFLSRQGEAEVEKELPRVAASVLVWKDVWGGIRGWIARMQLCSNGE